MRNFAKLAAAGALSLAIVSGSAFAATAPAWEKLGPERSYAEGLLSAAFAWLWALSGSPGECY